MDKITTVTGIAVPFRRSNVDTDQIIPAVFLKRVTKTGFDDALFHSWRQDPDFILNDPAYANPVVLIAGADFGTGSSREHAVWALRDYGFQAVISPRFGDIFRSNAGKQGLLAGTVSEEQVAQLWDRDRGRAGNSGHRRSGCQNGERRRPRVRFRHRRLHSLEIVGGSR